MMIWNLIKKFMTETENANNIQFADSAWQRAKQLETDIVAHVGQIEAEHRRMQLDQADEIKKLEQTCVRLSNQVISDAELATSAETVISELISRIKTLEGLLNETLLPLEAAGVDETDPEGLIMRIKSERRKNANG